MMAFIFQKYLLWVVPVCVPQTGEEVSANNEINQITVLQVLAKLGR